MGPSTLVATSTEAFSQGLQFRPPPGVDDMSALTVGSVAETAPRERRVALSPDGVVRLLATGQQVIIEAGAGAAAWFPDTDYTDAGARLVARRELYDQADIIVCVHPPAGADVSLLHPGQVLIGVPPPSPRTDGVPRCSPAIGPPPRRLSRARRSSVHDRHRRET